MAGRSIRLLYRRMKKARSAKELEQIFSEIAEGIRKNDFILSGRDGFLLAGQVYRTFHFRHQNIPPVKIKKMVGLMIDAAKDSKELRKHEIRSHEKSIKTLKKDLHFSEDAEYYLRKNMNQLV